MKKFLYILLVSLMSFPLATFAQAEEDIPEASEAIVEAGAVSETNSGVTLEEVSGYVENNIYKGTISITNDSDSPLADMYIEAMTLSGLENTTYQNFFSPQRFGSFSILPRNKITVKYSYKLPDVLFGTDPTLFLRATYEKGDTIGLTTIPLDLPKNPNAKSPVDLTGSSIEYKDKVYSAQEGPTFSASDNFKVHLTLNLQDATVSKTKTQPKLKLTPKVTIYDRVVNNNKIAETVLESIQISPNKETEIYLDISKIVKKAGVYEARIQLIDDQGIDRSEFIGIRYIIEGKIVTIKDLTLDYVAIKEGKNINAYTYFAGMPFNIVSKTTPSNGSYNFKVKLYSDQGVQIAEKSEKVNLDEVESAMIGLLPTMSYSGKARLELVVESEGVVYAEKNVMIEVPKPVQSKTVFYTFLIIAILLLVASIVLFKRGKLYSAVIVFLIAATVFGFASYTKIASATVVYTLKTKFNGTTTGDGPKITISIIKNKKAKGASFGPLLHSGDKFGVTGIAEASACLNANSDLSLKIAGVEKTISIRETKKHNMVQMRGVWTYGPFTASVKPGEKRLSFESVFHFYDDDTNLWGRSNGYKKYTVHPPAGLTTICPDGTVVENIADCPSTTPTLSHTCPNGLVVANLADCPGTPPPQLHTCPNGQLVATPADCPGTVADLFCPDGTPVQDLADCPGTPPPPDCTNDPRIGEACSTNTCSNEVDGFYQCTPAGLVCVADPSFSCDIGVIKKFEANPRNVNRNQACTLFWETENMKSCKIIDNNDSTLESHATIPNGNIPTGPVINTTRYTLSCKDDNGDDVSAVTDCRINVQFIQF